MMQDLRAAIGMGGIIFVATVLMAAHIARGGGMVLGVGTLLA